MPSKSRGQPSAACIARDVGGEGFDAAAFEHENVHSVYSHIAPHFSATRYKPWPLVPAFLSTLPSGAVGVDVGTGNGKYLFLRSALLPAPPPPPPLDAAAAAREPSADACDVVMLGLDRGWELLNLAQHNVGDAAPPSSATAAEHRQHIAAQPTRRAVDGRPRDPPTRAPRPRNEVLLSDALSLPVRSASVDFAICVATLHHLATRQRRLEAVVEMLRLVAPAPRAAEAHREPSRAPSVTTTARGARAEESSDPRNAARSSAHPYPELRSGGGRVLIVVWALEQGGEGKRDFQAGTAGPGSGVGGGGGETDGRWGGVTEIEASKPVSAEEGGSSGGGDGGLGQEGRDVLVPWVLSGAHARKPTAVVACPATIAAAAAKGSLKEVDGPRAPAAGQNGAGGSSEGQGHHDGVGGADDAAPSRAGVYHRFYHVFSRGELERLVDDAALELRSRASSSRGDASRTPPPPPLRVEREAGGWERGNWWGIWRVVRADPGID